MKKLSHSFYTRKTLKVAKELLGKILVRKTNKGIISGRIVEVEAYIGFNDPASHAYTGKTKRNASMFKEGGCAYIYFIYGMYYCVNVVTEKEGFPSAVLIRALEPLEGINLMKKNRKSQNTQNLTNGPGKLCQALNIDRELNGIDLCGETLFIADDGFYVSAKDGKAKKISSSSRIGVKTGLNHKWRFFIEGSRFVSV
jgi:DNA-3-methyladenine glycosylase